MDGFQQPVSASQCHLQWEKRIFSPRPHLHLDSSPIPHILRLHSDSSGWNGEERAVMSRKWLIPLLGLRHGQPLTRSTNWAIYLTSLSFNFPMQSETEVKAQSICVSNYFSSNQVLLTRHLCINLYNPH